MNTAAIHIPRPDELRRAVEEFVEDLPTIEEAEAAAVDHVRPIADNRVLTEAATVAAEVRDRLADTRQKATPVARRLAGRAGSAFRQLAGSAGKVAGTVGQVAGTVGPAAARRVRDVAAAREPAQHKEESGMLTVARRAVGLIFGGMAVTMVVGAVAALSMRGKLGPSTTTDPADDEIVAVAIFGPLAFRSTARSFRGGTLDCWYGGGALDLRDATLSPEGATIRVRAVFGGGQIVVPETWRVRNTVVGLGGVSDTRPVADRSDEGPELTIEGFVVFGGFAVVSELPEEEARWLETTKAGA
jgi:hypothetical protein